MEIHLYGDKNTSRERERERERKEERKEKRKRKREIGMIVNVWER